MIFNALLQKSKDTNYYAFLQINNAATQQQQQHQQQQQQQGLHRKQ